MCSYLTRGVCFCVLLVAGIFRLVACIQLVACALYYLSLCICIIILLYYVGPYSQRTTGNKPGGGRGVKDEGIVAIPTGLVTHITDDPPTLMRVGVRTAPSRLYVASRALRTSFVRPLGYLNPCWTNGKRSIRPRTKSPARCRNTKPSFSLRTKHIEWFRQ